MRKFLKKKKRTVRAARSSTSAMGRMRPVSTNCNNFQIGNMLDLTELPGSAINSRLTAPSQKTHMVQRLHDGTEMRSPIGQENLSMRNGL